MTDEGAGLRGDDASSDAAGQAADAPGRRSATSVRILLVAAAVIVVAVAGGVVFATVSSNGNGGQRSDDTIPHDVALYAPDDTQGLPLARAVTGEQLGSPDPGFVVIYGEDDDLRGNTLLLLSARAEGHYGPGDPDEHVRTVDINGDPGRLNDNAANDNLRLSWQPSNDRQVTLIGRGLDATQLVTAARAVTGDLRTAAVADPDRFGLHEIVQGPSAELAPEAMGFAPVWGGALVGYGRHDGQGAQLMVVTGAGEQLAVAVARILYEEAQDVTVTGHDAVVARMGSDPEDPFGWIVTWRQDDGAVIRVVGFGMTRDAAMTVAESVHLISGEEFRDLARRDSF
jgi:hypothetical protein